MPTNNPTGENQQTQKDDRKGQLGGGQGGSGKQGGVNLIRQQRDQGVLALAVGDELVAGGWPIMRPDSDVAVFAQQVQAGLRDLPAHKDSRLLQL